MKNLLILAFAGFVAQLIDGSLGMGYGVTSTTMLLALGLAPAVVSASVHAGEVITTLVSGISHWRFGNVDREMTWRLALPGAVGAFCGAVFLSRLPVHLARPGVSIFLFLLGIVVLFRFARPRKKAHTSRPADPRVSSRFLIPLGLIAGFFDATGGGGWGPIATSTLLSRGSQSPRQVVGSVDASEFLVALSATLGFILALGWTQINVAWTLAIVIGGVFAAPLAAWAVRLLPARILGITVGVMILVSNARTILTSLGVEVPLAIFLVLFAIPMLVALASVRWRKGVQVDG